MLYFISKIVARLEEAEVPCFIKCFRFRLLKKSNASVFASASSFFLQSASASTKI